MENLEIKRSVSERTHRKLATDWLENKRYCDVILQTDDGLQIPVHKAFLISSSSFFKTLFQGPMSTDERVARLHKIPMPILQIIMRWIYTRNLLGVDNDNVTDIIVHADYFGIAKVVDLCTVYMVENLDFENCIEVLKFASFYNLSGLRKAVFCFVLENFGGVCECQDNLENLDKEELKEILSSEDVNADELKLFQSLVRWTSIAESDRFAAFQDLLPVIRFCLLSESTIMEAIVPHRYIQSNEACLNILRPYIPEPRFVFQFYLQLHNPFVIRTPRQIVLAVGGWGLERPTNQIEVYIPGANNWFSITEVDPSGPRSFHGMALLGDHLYFLGGYDGTNYLKSCRIFNVVTREWKEISPMNSRRCYSCAVVLGGEIYVMGGHNGLPRSDRLDIVEKYNPKTNQWSFVASMNVGRSDAGVAAVDGKIYIFGGFDGVNALRSVEQYDPVADSWKFSSSMHTRRTGLSCVEVDGNIFALGGFNGVSRQDLVDRYQPGDETWSPMPSMREARSNFGATVLNGTLMVAGGYRKYGVMNHVEHLSLEDQQWSIDMSMHHPRSGVKLCTLVGLNQVRGYLEEARKKWVDEMFQI